MTKTRLASGLPILGANCRLLRLARSIDAAIDALSAASLAAKVAPDEPVPKLASPPLTLEPSAASALGSIDLRRFDPLALWDSALLPGAPPSPRAACAVLAAMSTLPPVEDPAFSFPVPGRGAVASSTRKGVSSARAPSSAHRTTQAMPTRWGRVEGAAVRWNESVEGRPDLKTMWVVRDEGRSVTWSRRVDEHEEKAGAIGMLHTLAPKPLSMSTKIMPESSPSAVRTSTKATTPWRAALPFDLATVVPSAPGTPAAFSAAASSEKDDEAADGRVVDEMLLLRRCERLIADVEDDMETSPSGVSVAVLTMPPRGRGATMLLLRRAVGPAGR